MQNILAVETPDVTVGGIGAASLQAALALAQPGDTIHLGAGTFRLTETLRVPSGVNLQGAGPQRTFLDGGGLGAAVSIRGTSNGITQLTVTGGRVGVSIADSHDASVRNVVVRGTTENGILVEGGCHGAGHQRHDRSCRGGGARQQARWWYATASFSAMKSGWWLLVPDSVTSNFNDVHGNVHNYDNVTAGTDDLDQAVAFVDEPGERLSPAAPAAHHRPGETPATNGTRNPLRTAVASILAPSATPPTRKPVGLSQTPGMPDPSDPGRNSIPRSPSLAPNPQS